MTADSTGLLLAQLFCDWLAERSGEAVAPPTTGPAGLFVTTVAGQRIAVDVAPMATGEPPAGWSGALAAFCARLQPGQTGGVLLWLPGGAAPPAQEPAASEALHAVQAAVDTAASGATAEARLPITLSIRKRAESGAYVSAFGGLAPLWAQFTDRVQGYYQIDSTALHRLPDDEAYIRGLIDRVVEASEGMALGEARAAPAEDHWLVQRLRAGAGCAALGLPPGDESENGAPLRKRLRAALREGAARLAGEPAELRVLALFAHYGSLEGEPVGPALRGLDPALFGGLDLVVLLANGAVKPLIDITRKALHQRRNDAAPA